LLRFYARRLAADVVGTDCPQMGQRTFWLRMWWGIFRFTRHLGLGHLNFSDRMTILS